MIARKVSQYLNASAHLLSMVNEKDEKMKTSALLTSAVLHINLTLIWYIAELGQKHRLTSPSFGKLNSDEVKLFLRSLADQESLELLSLLELGPSWLTPLLSWLSGFDPSAETQRALKGGIFQTEESSVSEVTVIATTANQQLDDDELTLTNALFMVEQLREMIQRHRLVSIEY